MPAAPTDGRRWRRNGIAFVERLLRGERMHELEGRVILVKDLGACTVVRYNPDQYSGLLRPPATHTVRCRDGSRHDIVLQRVRYGAIVGCPYRILEEDLAVAPRGARPSLDAPLARHDIRTPRRPTPRRPDPWNL